MSQRQAPGPNAVHPTLVDSAAEEVLGRFDWNANGFGPRPEDPEPEALAFLLALGLRTGKPYALRAALRSLSALPRSQAFDQVEGGFFRAAGDAKGRKADTAKPLALNARIVQLLALSFAWTKDPEQRRVALDTAAYLDRTLSVPDSHLWAGHQEADEEYYAKMGHRRDLHGAPAVAASPSLEGSAAAVSTFALAGAAFGEPRLVARARIAFDELKGGATEGASDAVPAAGLVTAGLDLLCATGDDALKAPIADAGGRLASEAAAPTSASFALLDGGRRCAALVRLGVLAGQAQLQEEASLYLRVLHNALPGSGPAAGPFGLAALGLAHGVIEVRWSGGRFQGESGACARSAAALASSVGPSVLRAVTAGAQSAAFGLGKATSGEIRDPSECKTRLAELLLLHETI